MSEEQGIYQCTSAFEVPASIRRKGSWHLETAIFTQHSTGVKAASIPMRGAGRRERWQSHWSHTVWRLAVVQALGVELGAAAVVSSVGHEMMQVMRTSLRSRTPQSTGL